MKSYGIIDFFKHSTPIGKSALEKPNESQLPVYESFFLQDFLATAEFDEKPYKKDFFYNSDKHTLIYYTKSAMKNFRLIGYLAAAYKNILVAATDSQAVINRISVILGVPVLYIPDKKYIEILTQSHFINSTNIKTANDIKSIPELCFMLPLAEIFEKRFSENPFTPFWTAVKFLEDDNDFIDSLSEYLGTELYADNELQRLKKQLNRTMSDNGINTPVIKKYIYKYIDEKYMELLPEMSINAQQKNVRNF